MQILLPGFEQMTRPSTVQTAPTLKGLEQALERMDVIEMYTKLWVQSFPEI